MLQDKRDVADVAAESRTTPRAALCCARGRPTALAYRRAPPPDIRAALPLTGESCHLLPPWLGGLGQSCMNFFPEIWAGVVYIPRYLSVNMRLRSLHCPSLHTPMYIQPVPAPLWYTAPRPRSTTAPARPLRHRQTQQADPTYTRYTTLSQCSARCRY
jgi:hypothetical protein